MKNYIQIGKLAATFGVDGEMVLQHDLGKKTAFKDLETIFLENRPGAFLPYFIKDIRVKSESEVYLKLEDVKSKEAAKPYLKKQVWLTEDDFKKYASKSAPISFIGFSIVEDDQKLGEVLEVIEQKMQVLCRIEMDGKEVLIPLNESTLIKVDRKKRIVYVELPEGLLDIYK